VQAVGSILFHCTKSSAFLVATWMVGRMYAERKWLFTSNKNCGCRWQADR